MDKQKNFEIILRIDGDTVTPYFSDNENDDPVQMVQAYANASFQLLTQLGLIMDRYIETTETSPTFISIVNDIAAEAIDHVCDLTEQNYCDCESSEYEIIDHEDQEYDEEEEDDDETDDLVSYCEYVC